MDHFGIGPALQALLRVYRQSARATGRTNSLVASVHNGDRIICCGEDERRRLLGLLENALRDVEVVMVDPGTPEKMMTLPACVGRTLFEHTWVELFYELALGRAAKEIYELQQHASRPADLLGVAQTMPRPDPRWSIS